MHRLLALVGGVLLANAALAESWPRNLADPCTHVRDRGDLHQIRLPDPAITNAWDLAYPEAFAGNETALRGVVFIVNGNGANEAHYRGIGEHLARQNFMVRLIKRPGAGYQPLEIEQAMSATFAHYDLPEDFPVVLMGHSKGGGSVLEVTRLFSHSYNIDAVISIAPNAESLQGFLGSDAPAYLALYGSQDEDMSGTGGEPHEGFMAYDLVNLETTTASPANRWAVITPNRVDKAMVYVRGADHSGFIGLSGLQLLPKHFDYLSVPDQFCIAKAYTSAFLDWKLDGETGYRGMFNGSITPPSVAAIKSAEPDYFGNPAGEPLQKFHQFSPMKRLVLANFWNTPPLIAGPDMQASVIYPFAHDTRARHYSKALRIAWKPGQIMRHVTMSVPETGRNIAAFDTFQFRIGQINTGDAQVANTEQAEPPMLLTLVDGSGQSVHRFIHGYGRIPGHDRRSGGGRGHSHMNTISIPMDDLSSIDLTDVRLIRFWVYPQTRGEVMIDNIEAAYDF